MGSTSTFRAIRHYVRCTAKLGRHQGAQQKPEKTKEPQIPATSLSSSTIHDLQAQAIQQETSAQAAIDFDTAIHLDEHRRRRQPREPQVSHADLLELHVGG